ncbi:phage major capsid protein [Reyranella sp.]|uniref:phage major capsid protein n=1 Tax=Reyranella sp. TaxID=1929291 RepID=UPI003D0A9A47
MHMPNRRHIERKGGAGISVADEIRKIVDPLMTGFEEFKKTNDQRLAEIEKKGTADPLTLEKLEKIETDLAQAEEVNQKLVAIEREAKAAIEREQELRETIDKLELKLKRPRLGGDDVKAQLKAAHSTWAWAAVLSSIGGIQLSDEHRKALADVEAECKSLSIQNDTTGGYLAPPEYVKEIIKGITEMSPVRSLVRVRSTGSKSIMLPKRTGQFAARRVGEQETRTETTGLTWGMIEIVAPEMCALIDISRQNLEDSAFDLEAELRLEADEQFAVKEGAEVVSGTGVNQCEGFLTNNDVGTTVSGSAASVADADGQADGILTLKHSIKTAYTRNASWALNRTTLGSVRKLKDGNKQYIWMPGLALGKPNTIDGDPYVEVPDMPSEGANTYPIAYGDFARAYTLVDRLAMSLQRDNLTQATSGNVRFLFWKRVGGAVTLAEAIRKLKCSA